MSKITKYIVFTFIATWTITMIGVKDFNSGGTAGLISFSYATNLGMAMPTIGALVAKANIREMGWKPRLSNNVNLLFFAWLAPTVFSLIGALLYFIVFPEDFNATGAILKENEPAVFAELEANGSSYTGYIVSEIFKSLISIKTFVAVFWGLGEEIGWRGFFYPELKKYIGRTKALLLGGVVHGAWHFPLMLLVGYEYGYDYIGAPFLGLFAFCIFTVSTGIISDYLYVKSNSIWFPAIFHGTINSSINPYLLRGLEHPERTIFGPADIGLISVIPIVTVAAAILYIENRRENMEYSEI